jgi:hypothetical protein
MPLILHPNGFLTRRGSGFFRVSPQIGAGGPGGYGLGVNQSPRAPSGSRRLGLGLAYGHLNLRRNPFGELPLAERAPLAVVDLESHLEPHLLALGAGGFALQFLGDKGTGKTSHLLAIGLRFPGAPYIHIPEGERPRTFPPGEPLFLDEAQRVPSRARREIFRTRRSLVLGTHRDFRGELEGAGLRVVTIIPAAIQSAGRLATIFDRRIESARRGPGPLPGVSHATIDRLRVQHGPNVRAMEDELFEHFLSLAEIGDV